MNEGQPDFVFEKIEELSRDNAIVKSVLTMHRSGLISREQALIWMVLSLADQNADMGQRLKEIYERGLPPVVLNVTPEEAERIKRQGRKGE